MPTKQEQLDAILIKTAQAYEGLSEELQNYAIEQTYRTLVDLNNLLMQYTEKDDTINKARVASLINDLQAIEQAIFTNGMQAMQEVAKQSAEANINGSNIALATAVGASAEITEDMFNRISAETIRYVANRFGEDGLVLSDRIWALAKNQRADLEQVIRNGIIRGESVNTLVAKVRGVYDNQTWKIRRLVITEGNVAYRTASAYVAQQSEVVRGLRIHRGEADRPEHRCTQLEKEDRYGFGKGVFLPTDKDVLSPHVNCTSYTTYELFEDLKEQDTHRKNPVKAEPKKFEPTETEQYKGMVRELDKGTPISKLGKADIATRLAMHNARLLNKNATFNEWDLDPQGIKDIFGEGVTLEGLAHVYNPDPSRFRMSVKSFKVGERNADFSFDIRTLDGKKQVGTIHREIFNINGKLIVQNHLLEIDPKFQGQDLATNLYFKSEQFYKRIAGDKPVTITMLANLDVGVYAWTRHGFDFVDKDMADSARNRVSKMLEQRIKERLDAGEFGIPNKTLSMDDWKALKPKLFTEYVNKMGYNSLDEIVHSWQFASLDIGERFVLSGGANISGEGHLGKALMLNMGSWKGKKVLNGSDGETVGNMYYERKGVK